MALPPCEFGTCSPGVEYRLRPGGYVVLKNEKGDIAVIETKAGVHLPGGGQEAGESIEDAAVREALEEIGWLVRLESFVGVADQFVFGSAENTHFRKRCTFYTATLLARESQPQAEAEPTWVAPNVAIERLTEGSQRWAVERACGLRAR